MLESDYQSELIVRIEERFPKCMVLKNDAGYIQGIPDLLVLCEGKWAALEVKTSEDSPHQPNQDHYIEKMDDLSFAAFIHPENEQEILNEFQQSL